MAKKKEEPAPLDKRPEWMRNHIWQIQPVRDVLVIFAVFGLFWIGYKLSIVTVPLLLALSLAYLLEDRIKWLTRKGLSRQTAVSGVIAFGVLLIVLPSVGAAIFGINQAIAASRTITRNVEYTETIREVSEAIAGRAEQDQGFLATYEFSEDERSVDVEVSDEDWGRGQRISSGPYAGRQPRAQDIETSYGRSNWIFRIYQRSVIDQALGRYQPAPPGDEAPGVDQAEGDSSGEGGEVAGEEAGQQNRLVPSPRKRSLLDSLFDFAAGYAEANRESLSARAIGTSVNAAAMVVNSVTSVGVIGFMAFLTAFFFFFIASAYGKVADFLRGLIPEQKKPLYLDMASKMDRAIKGFVGGRMLIAFFQMIFFTLAYAFVGVPVFFLLGPIVAVLSIVPYLSLIGIPVSIILMFANAQDSGLHSQWWWIVFAPTGVYFVGQALDDYVLTPRIQGEKTGMDTPSILFATIAGGALAGFYGVLLAIPAAACLKIVIKEIFWPRFKAWSEGKEKDFLPIGRS